MGVFIARTGPIFEQLWVQAIQGPRIYLWIGGWAPECWLNGWAGEQVGRWEGWMGCALIQMAELESRARRLSSIAEPVAELDS